MKQYVIKCSIGYVVDTTISISMFAISGIKKARLYNSSVGAEIDKGVYNIEHSKYAPFEVVPVDELSKNDKQELFIKGQSNTKRFKSLKDEVSSLTERLKYENTVGLIEELLELQKILERVVN